MVLLFRKIETTNWNTLNINYLFLPCTCKYLYFDCTLVFTTETELLLGIPDSYQLCLMNASWQQNWCPHGQMPTPFWQYSFFRLTLNVCAWNDENQWRVFWRWCGLNSVEDNTLRKILHDLITSNVVYWQTPSISHWVTSRRYTGQ